MRFEALGPLTVLNGGQPVQLRPASRKVLACFLLTPGDPIPVSRLAELLWNRAPPPTARTALQVHISELRRKIGTDIRFLGDSYHFELAGAEFDVTEFQAAAAAAASALSEGKFGSAQRHATHAVGLWRSEPFPELVDVVDAQSQVQRLADIFVGAKLHLAHAMAVSGRPSESIAILRPLTEQHQLNEAVWEELILAYYLSGRQADALAAYQEAARILGEELGISPGPRLKDLEERVLLQAPDLTDGVALGVPHNLPLLESSFVGRERDMDAVIGLLGGHHLVTIVGTPGVGKTRLGIETATRILGRFPGGVWLARLAGAHTARDVLSTIIAATGVTETVDSIESLTHLLGQRPALLILDNCEHVTVEVNELIGDSLVGDRLRILATSRARLGVPNEVAWRLQPLEIPRSIETMWESPALRLLADRMTTTDPTVRLDRIDENELIEISRSTAGMPLAIELIARWLPVVDADRPGQEDHSPSGEDETDAHHASVAMASAIDRSVALLHPDDQKTFVAASVFASPFTPSALGAVCMPGAPQHQVGGALRRLVEASLLVAERAQDGVRYRMLEPLRQFASGRLSGKRKRVIADRHAGWFLERAQEVTGGITASPDPTTLSGIKVTVADFRLAMRHFLDTGRPELAAAVAGSLAPFWVTQFQGREGQLWLEECLAGDLDYDHRFEVLCAAGQVGFFVGRYDEAAAHFREARELAVSHRDSRRQAQAMFGEGVVHSNRDQAEGRALLRTAAVIFEDLGDRAGVALARYNDALFDAYLGKDEARAILLESEGIFADLERTSERSACHRYLSLLAWHQGDEAEARGEVELAELLARESGDRRVLAGALSQKGMVEGRWGDPKAAAEAIIESLWIVAGHHGIYFALAAFGALPVLVRQQKWDVAARLLAQIDHEHAVYGWTPVDQRNAAAPFYREQITEALIASNLDPDLTPLPTSEMTKLLSSKLAEVRDA